MRLLSIVVALLCAVPARVIAEGGTVSFDDVLKVAMAKSPERGRLDAELAERLSEAEEIRVKQNPTLDTELRLPQGGGEYHSEYEASISQPIRASDLGFRSKLAALMEEAISVEQKAVLVEFTQNLSLTYARAWAVQERRAVLVSSKERTRGILEKVRRAASGGIVPEGDVAVFEGEVGLLSAEIVGADAERKRAMAELVRASGAELSRARLLALPPPRLPALDETLRQATGSSLPAQQRSEILARVARRQLELTRLDRFPQIAPVLGYERTAEGADQLKVGLSIDLPLFNRNQAARVRALGAARAAERLRDHATSGWLAEEAEMLHEAAAALADQRQRFEDDIIPARERALRGYRKQFEVGQGTAFQVWQAQRELTDATLRALDLRTEERTAVAELNILLGTDL
jgi:outer membrane protein TolC